MSVSEPVPPSGSGDSIGGYRILKTLGRGGMGEVFLAWDERLQRELAVKRIRHDSALTEILRQRLLREAQAAARLSHPAIVHIYDLKEDPAGDCIVMEYVPGQTLAEALTVRPFEPAPAARLAREIASGLAAAHAAGIVHRDLKTENVILTPSGNAKILDFGLAKPFVPAAGDPSLTERGGVVGTCRSMSPEQARGGEVDGRSDLFSLGVLLYEVLTGEHPFHGATSLESIAQVLKHHPPRVDVIRPGVPPRLGLLVERLLAKDAADRPQSAEEVVRELEAIEGALSSPASEETLSDLPTGYFPAPPLPSQPLPRPSKAPESTAGMSITSGSQRLRMTALAGLVALAITIYILWPRPPLRVLALWPEVKDKDELSRKASLVLETTLNTLRELDGVEPIDESDLPGAPKSWQEKVSDAQADEVVVATFERKDPDVQITLTSKDSKGKVRQSRRFSWPIAGMDYNRLADEVTGSLRKLYPDRQFHPSPAAEAEEVRPEDYAKLRQIKLAIGAGKISALQALDDLQPVLASSPQFLQARLLAVELNLNQFYSTRRNDPFLDTAIPLVHHVKDQRPGDFHVLRARFNLEMARGSLDAATRILSRLKDNWPRYSQVRLLEAKLAKRQGRLDEALEIVEALGRQLPTWENLYYLAEIEESTGHSKEARNAIQRILSVSPDNIWAREKLAEIELFFGDLEKADSFYRELIEGPAQRAELTNLGLVQLLRGNYQDAFEKFGQVYPQNRYHFAVNIDLADTEVALGKRESAMAHYKQALDHLNGVIPQTSLLPGEIVARAQCLAYLDPEHRRKTEEDVENALRQTGDDPDVLQGAALVYAVLKEKYRAFDCIKRALDEGVQPRWFQLPAFAELQKDPEFQRLINTTPGATPSR